MNSSRRHLPMSQDVAQHLRDLRGWEQVPGAQRLVDRLRLDVYLREMHDAGWTLEELGEPLGVTRERIRQRVVRAGTVRADGLPPVVPPRHPSPLPKARPVHKIKSGIVDELRHLYALGRQAKGGTPLDSPIRRASLDLNALILQLLGQRITIQQVADALGVKHQTVNARLKRHGHRPQAPSQPRYLHKVTIPPGSGGRRDRCSRGHDMTGDNLRLVNNDPSRRVCRRCERIRSDKYRARLASVTDIDSARAAS